MMSKQKDNKKAVGFTDEERVAMKERVLEQQAEAKLSKNGAVGENALLDKLAEMPKADRVIDERIHEIVKGNAPELMPKIWYEMRKLEVIINYGYW